MAAVAAAMRGTVERVGREARRRREGVSEEEREDTAGAALRKESSGDAAGTKPEDILNDLMVCSDFVMKREEESCLVEWTVVFKFVYIV